ncbi:MAG: hypothetical protein LUQ11_00340 [Methylococcaceae bacterium]|nr:hypothetical protein [Methylococcaceae bacterium]
MRTANSIKSILLFGLFWGALNVSFAQEATYPLTESGLAPKPETETNQPSQSEANVPSDLDSQKLSTCTMTYSMKGFSLAYKQYDGFGEVQCRNGQKAQVVLSSKSVGFTIGKSEIDGEGHFTDVKDIQEIFGNYVSLGNHFGFLKSIDRQVLTKGEVSLALIGKGRGIDIGFTIGDLNITRR